MNKFILILSLVLFNIAHSDQNGSYGIEEMVQNETKDNAASQRDSNLIDIDHYEIPLRLLEASVADRMPKLAKEALIFEKNGEKYIRWMKNPEDTKWYKDVEKFLEKNHLPSKPQKYFKGYQTASRSHIVVDPVSGYALSLKVSTDHTGGAWKDKKQPWIDAREVRVSTDAFVNAMKKFKPSDIVFLDEPASYGIKSIDQGMIVRILGDEINAPTPKKYYIPGFSVLHEEEGRRIAKLNGATDVAAFWNKHYNIPLAKALAELFAMTGFTYDSPHSQNFMVETDENFKPTGRIVLKDLGDIYMLEDFYSAMGDMSIPRNFEAGNVIKGRTHMAVGLLHGNQPPSWLSEKQYQAWAKDFYKEFEQQLSKLTGIPEAELSKSSMGYRTFSYASKDYQVTSAWKPFLARLRVNKGFVSVSNCANLFN